MSLADISELQTAYQLNGNAYYGSTQGGIVLTDDVFQEAGTAILRDTLLDASLLSNGAGLVIEYELYAQPNGGDGHACFLLDASEGADYTALGQAGGGKGVAGLDALGFEVEEFLGGQSSIFTTDSSGNNQTFGTAIDTNAAVTGTHTYAVTFFYNETFGSLTIGATRDGDFLLESGLSIGSSPLFLLGFSASTGGSSAEHTLLSVSTTAVVAPPVAPLIAPNWIARRGSY